jgi:hypothetical protein
MVGIADDLAFQARAEFGRQIYNLLAKAIRGPPV